MRAILLLTLAAAAIAQTFDVASIKPAAPPIGRTRGNKVLDDGVDFQAASLKFLITFAYNVKDYQVVGPDWLADGHWEVLAKSAGPATRDEIAARMRALLAERFHLQAHTETRDYAGLALVVAKGGPKLKPAAPGAAEPVSPTMTFHFGGGGNIRSPRISMDTLAARITAILGKPVVDDTRITGDYDVSLEYAPGESIQQTRGSLLPPPPNPNPGVSIFTSIQELGLRLESRKLQLPTIVVDKIEKTPTEN